MTQGESQQGSHQLVLFSLVGVGSSTDDSWQQESEAYMMHLVTSCQLQHIVHTVKTHFIIKFWHPKFSVSPLETPPPVPCAAYWSWDTLDKNNNKSTRCWRSNCPRACQNIFLVCLTLIFYCDYLFFCLSCSPTTILLIILIILTWPRHPYY